MGTVAQNCWIATALFDACPDDTDVATAVQTCANHVVQHARPEGWTYFNNCPDIPPDTDDLALAMSLLRCAQWPRLERLLSGPLRLLRENTASPGAFRTWLCQDGQPMALDERWVSHIAPVQPDVVANIAWALLSGGHHEWELDIKSAIHWLSADPVARLSENHWYYGDGYIGFIMMRLFCDCPSEWYERKQADVAAQTLAESLRSGQLSDGSWPHGNAPIARRTLARNDVKGNARSCLETAWRVAALREIERAEDLDAIRSAQRFLVRRQMADGAYAAEPFFETVSPQPYGSRGITSAAVLRALSPAKRQKLCAAP